MQNTVQATLEALYKSLGNYELIRENTRILYNFPLGRENDMALYKSL
jgi:hypothetical protein